MNDELKMALEATVQKIKNMSVEELKLKLKESENSPFAKTINELIEFSGAEPLFAPRMIGDEILSIDMVYDKDQHENK